MQGVLEARAWKGIRVWWMASILTLTISLTACDNGSPGTGSPSTAVTATPGSLEAEIQALESQGKLPKLDRSDDLKGPDTDGNGVRDDIDEYVGGMNLPEEKKKAVQKIARSLNSVLNIDTYNEKELQLTINENAIAMVCLSDAYGEKYEEAYKMSAAIEAYTFNTKARSLRYMAYNKALNGFGAAMPSKCPTASGQATGR